jgi:hypothetical protein
MDLPVREKKKKFLTAFDHECRNTVKKVNILKKGPDRQTKALRKIQKNVKVLMISYRAIN